MAWKHKYASQLINDVSDPDNEMFYSKGFPPDVAKVYTGPKPSEITLVSLCAITECLAGYLAPGEYKHTAIEYMYLDGQQFPMDPDTIVVHLYYLQAPSRVMTFTLSHDKGILALN